MQDNQRKMRMLLYSQHLILFGSGMVFPYYVIFIRGVGANFSQFGWAYALFALSSALVHTSVGKLSDRFGNSLFLALSAWGTAFVLVLFPAVTSIYHVYVLQVIMGLFNAFQKTSEKALVANITQEGSRGKRIGQYHAWTALSSGLAVIVAGYVIDILTLDIIFYAGSLFMFVSGFLALKIRDGQSI